MARPTDSELRAEMRDKLTERVERYTRNPTAQEHEHLLPLVGEVFGDNAAEFFDREGCLPLSTGGFPWPMKSVAARMYALTVLAASVLGSIAAAVVLWNFLAPWVAALVAVLFGVTLWFGIPRLTKLFPPADLEERNRLVGVFDDIATRNRAAAEERAMQARMERLLRENDDRL